MKLMKITIKNICLLGMGIALFVILSRLMSMPVFENYYLCLGYVVMAVYLYSVGVFSGTIVGVFGTVLYCFLINGLRGMPGWALGNIAIGLILGLWFKFIHKNKRHRSSWFITDMFTTIVIITSVAIGILGIKSVVEMFLYSQPFMVRIASNIYAFVADVAVLVVSIPIYKTMDKIIKKHNLI